MRRPEYRISSSILIAIDSLERVTVARIEDRSDLLFLEWQRRRRRHFDGFDPKHEVGAHPFPRDAKMKEALQAFLFLAFRDRAVRPGRAELRQLVARPY